MSHLYWLTAAQMQRLKPFFPKSYGKTRVDDRRVLSIIGQHGSGPGNQSFATAPVAPRIRIFMMMLLQTIGHFDFFRFRLLNACLTV
ncbi:hypothetical protein SAMN05421538_11538 [Paracoccus isoporae]|uniref:Transposase, IS5 family n=1 Tax=Paracoccus isoporae TaxID=591205 RepID=A0A1G7GXQ9_9RHOB|nr:hypothetical protein SAMN05421538_11538 [Paracoccus isoporae]